MKCKYRYRLYVETPKQKVEVYTKCKNKIIIKKAEVDYL